MRSAVAAALVLALASPALAGPLSIGARLGAAQSEVDAGDDAGQSVGLYARLQLGRRLAAQLEVSKLDDSSGNEFRTGTGLLVLDLRDARRGPLVPTLLAGVGADRQDVGSWGAVEGVHAEAGLGLEYRAPGGLVIGVDVRVGSRQLNQYAEAVPAYDDSSGNSPVTPRGDGTNLLPPCDPAPGYPEGCGSSWDAGGSMRSGEYRAAHVTVGIRF